ncbi:hypothetical protein CN645_18385 [Burkholderia sp. IDO3]|nr:hypothetical protein DCN14_23320 [Burkholderia sp. IDO3]PCD60413.1 hypothetical protein CN645_18385 [Burkholderia sp. IDO3]
MEDPRAAGLPRVAAGPRHGGRNGTIASAWRAGRAENAHCSRSPRSLQTAGARRDPASRHPSRRAARHGTASSEVVPHPYPGRRGGMNRFHFSGY